MVNWHMSDTLLESIFSKLAHVRHMLESIYG